MTKKPPIDKLEHVRVWAGKTRDALSFDSTNVCLREYRYVAWIDVMGAGQIMQISAHKAANFIARMHMAVELALHESGLLLDILPINDGIFIFSERKSDIITVVRRIYTLLAGVFISTPQQQNRFLIRGAIAYGPIFQGKALMPGVKASALRGRPELLKHVTFGPAIAQAYEGERLAAAYGVAIDVSARSFASPEDEPFQTTHWLWWHDNLKAVQEAKLAGTTPPLSDLKRLLALEIHKHLKWLREGLVFSPGLSQEKISKLRLACSQYFNEPLPTEE